MLAAKADDDPIRVWSAGCATGQEAYSVAMVLAEALGEDAYRERVKIYATDVDEERARRSARDYSAKEVDAVAPELRERYFERSDQRMAFRKDLRRTVIFGRNDLRLDAPISRLDLLVCRNTLMYFTAEAQAAIVRHFHFALQDPGLLVLGKSEMMISHRDLFTPLDLRRRVFRRVSGESPCPRASPASSAGATRSSRSEDGAQEPRRRARDRSLRAAHRVARRHARRSSISRLGRCSASASRTSGGRSHELELAHHPVDLRGRSTTRCATAGGCRSARAATCPEGCGTRPRRDGHAAGARTAARSLGVNIVFEDVTRYVAMQRELEGNRRDLEMAYEELQSTIDELETTNEELQSANEELQTTNEELQSTNEELETMNEELQSTNEELETINDELRDRTSELNRVNGFLEAMLTSLAVGVAVVDREQRVQVWNQHAEDLWGLRRDEALDRPLLALDVGLAARATSRGRSAPSSRGASDARARRARGRQPAGTHDSMRDDNHPPARPRVRRRAARRDRPDGGRPGAGRPLEQRA